MKADDCIQKAYQCILNSDFEAAIRYFEQAIAQEPHVASHHYRCSVTHARSNHLDQAVQCAKRAIQLAPGQEEYVLHLHALEARQYTAEARRLLEGDQRHDQAITHLALSLLTEAVRLDPLSGDALVLTALAYGELSRYDDAIRAIQEAQALLPHEEKLNRLLVDMHRRKLEADTGHEPH